MRSIRLIKWVFVVLAIGLIVGATLGPIYWVGSSSLKDVREIIAPVPTAYPHGIDFRGYDKLFRSTNFVNQLKNSVVVSVFATLITVLVVAFAGFGAYRGKVKWLKSLKYFAILAFIFPTSLLVVPVYQVLAQLGVVNTVVSLILVDTMLAAPFAFWLIEGFFEVIPKELEEAALVDGATQWQAGVRIVLPLVAPGLATSAIYAFVTSWTEYTFSSVLVIDSSLKTLPLGLADVLAQYNIDWPLLTSSTTLAMIPGIVFFALAGRYFVGGLVAGALKA